MGDMTSQGTAAAATAAPVVCRSCGETITFCAVNDAFVDESDRLFCDRRGEATRHEPVATDYPHLLIHSGRPGGFGWHHKHGRVSRMPVAGESVEVVSTYLTPVGAGRYVWRYDPFWQTEVADTFAEIAPGRTLKTGGRRASWPHPITGETTIRLRAFDASTGEEVTSAVFDAKIRVEAAA